MIRLNEKQISDKISFINNYINAENAATASTMDANANVDSKNIATMEAELWKDANVQINRRLLTDRITNLYDKQTADKYISMLESHEIYTHDETSLKPYCVSLTMYPFLLDGLSTLGGESKAPKHLSSFCGSFVNFVFATSSQFAGAVATVEFLMYFDYFARRDYGDNYLTTNASEIANHLQHVVYAINQPAAARGYQCVRADTTQLSTPEGYKYLHELKEDDKCYVYKEGKIEIETINKLNIYDDFDGELIQFKGRNYQQTVTPNHRVLYKKPNSQKYDIKEAHLLKGHSKLSLPIGSKGIDRKDYPIQDSILKLCVAVLTDGSIEKYEDYNNFSGRISIYKSKNRFGYDEIKEWLEENGIGYSILESKGNDFGELVTYRITKEESQLILRYLKHTKKEIPFFFKLLSKRQIEIVIDTWSKFDGNNDEKHIQLLQCDNEDIREMMQELATLAGYGSEIYDRKMKTYDGEKDCIVKYVKIFKRKDKRVSEYNMIPFKGTVWCPSTDAGIVIFREENKIPYISGNSVFWNISIYDKPYFDAMFSDFKFPDFTAPDWSTVNGLQQFFMKWFNKERTKAILTYPVVTAACLTDGTTMVDKDFEEFISEELSEGNSFFVFMSENAHALSSCCRLKNDVSDSINDFSYSLGAGGVSTGSINVITMNINRLVQDAVNHNIPYLDYIKSKVQDLHKFQIAYRSIIQNYVDSSMLPVYTTGYISLDKQYLTLGINGLVEAAEFLGLDITDNTNYKNFISSIVTTISNENKVAAKLTGFKFNTEMVPAENLGVKNAKWDKKDGYVVSRDCYNSYNYKVEDESVSILEKFEMHGKEFMKGLDGGSAYHCNLDEYPSQEGFKKLLKVAATVGCEYFCFNVRITICNECNHIDKRTNWSCSKCGSKDVDHATRVIGYLKRVSAFSSDRQKEHTLRHYSVEK